MAGKYKRIAKGMQKQAAKRKIKNFVFPGGRHPQNRIGGKRFVAKPTRGFLESGGYSGDWTVSNDGVVTWSGFSAGYRAPYDPDPVPLQTVNYIRGRSENLQLQLNMVGNVQIEGSSGPLESVYFDSWFFTGGPYKLDWNGTSLYLASAMSVGDRDALLAQGALDARGVVTVSETP